MNEGRRIGTVKQFKPNELRSALAQSQVLGVHPDADALTAFAEGTLLARERMQVMKHLAGCAVCRELVSIAVSAAPGKAAVGPQLVSRSAGRGLRSWMPWMGIAAAITIVSTALLVHRRIAAPRPGGNEVAIVELRPSVPTPATPTADLPDQLGSERQTPQRTAAVARREASQATRARSISAPAPPTSVVPAPLLLDRAEATTVTPSGAPADEEGKFHGATNETISVNADSAQLETQTAQDAHQPVVGGNAPALEKKSPGSAKSMSPFSVGVVGALATPKPMAKAVVRPQWRIDEEGHAERSFGDGTWHTVLANETGLMRVVSTFGNDVWVGGEQQQLFHSSDNGTTWVAVALPTRDGTLHVITQIRFTSAEVGSVGADDGTSWTTTDRGATWH